MRKFVEGGRWAWHSPGRRLIRRMGFALSQAALVGLLLGAFAYFRVDRAELWPEPWGNAEGSATSAAERSWLLRLRLTFERFEAVFYDARVRALARAGERPESPVVVAIDPEAELQSQQTDITPLGTFPWTRSILGGLVGELLDEGASVVMLDLPLGGGSAAVCAAAEVTGSEAAGSDDAVFRERLEPKGVGAVLPFTWVSQPGRWAGPAPTPYVFPVQRYAQPSDARAALRAVLAHRRPAFLVPQGKGAELLAGATSPEEAQRLVSDLRLEGASPAAIRPLTSDERRHQISPQQLGVSLAEVTVEGLELERLPRAGNLTFPAVEAMATGNLYGSVTLPLDEDGRLRGVPQLIRVEPSGDRPRVLPSLALAAAMKLAGSRELRYQSGRLWVGRSYSIPMDRSGYSLLRWNAADVGTGPRGTLKRDLSAWRIATNWADAIAGRIPHYQNDLQDRPVVFTRSGLAAGGGGPLRDTPVGARLGSGAIWGQALANIIASSGIARAEPAWDFWATVLMAFLGAALALIFSRSFRSWRGVLRYFSGLAIAALFYLAYAFHRFVDHQQWVSVAGPLSALGLSFAATTAYAYRTEARMRRFVGRVLGRYATLDMLRRVDRDLSLMRPSRRTVTLLFSDIEGFTQQASHVTPESLVALLHEYLNDVTEIVRAHGGVVSEQIGDAVMAFWGAPIADESDARRACEALMELQAWVDERHKDWERRLGFKVRLRFGLYTGEAVVGDMGSDLKPHYTVMGDAVSFGLKLVSANRTYGTAILAGPQTRASAGPTLTFREVDRIMPSFGTDPVSVYELLGRTDGLTSKDREGLGRFENGLALYREQRFIEAQLEFLACLEAGDSVAALYVQRCVEYLEVPPFPEWDGVYERRR